MIEDFGGKQRLVTASQAGVALAGHVLSGERGHDPEFIERGRHIQTQQERVRMRRQHRPSMQ